MAYKIEKEGKTTWYSFNLPIVENGENVSQCPDKEYFNWVENDSHPEIFITINIPVSLIMGQPAIQQKIDMINRLYSDIHRRTENGTCELSNIALKFVKEFLTAQEYAQLKGLGIEFSPADQVEALFANPTEDEEATV